MSFVDCALFVAAVALPVAFCLGLVRIVRNWMEYSGHE